MVYENEICIDNQIDDGEPEALYSARYVKAVKFARVAGSYVHRVVHAPKQWHNKAVHIIDQFDRATGRM